MFLGVTWAVTAAVVGFMMGRLSIYRQDDMEEPEAEVEKGSETSKDEVVYRKAEAHKEAKAYGRAETHRKSENDRETGNRKKADVYKKMGTRRKAEVGGEVENRGETEADGKAEVRKEAEVRKATEHTHRKAEARREAEVNRKTGIRRETEVHKKTEAHREKEGRRKAKSHREAEIRREAEARGHRRMASSSVSGRRGSSRRKKDKAAGEVKTWSVGSPVSGKVTTDREGEQAAVVIRPEEDCLYAPACGKITRLFPMGNAFRFATEFGAELYIQAGDGNDELLARYYRPRILQNEVVGKGKLLLEFDRQGLEAEGASTEVSVCVESCCYGGDVQATTSQWVNTGEEILQVREPGDHAKY